MAALRCLPMSTPIVGPASSCRSIAQTSPASQRRDTGPKRPDPACGSTAPMPARAAPERMRLHLCAGQLRVRITSRPSRRYRHDVFTAHPPDFSSRQPRHAHELALFAVVQAHDKVALPAFCIRRPTNEHPDLVAQRWCSSASCRPRRVLPAPMWLWKFAGSPMVHPESCRN